MSITSLLTLLLVYTIVMVLLSKQFKKSNKLKEFLVANRNMSWWKTGFSMASTWIWAPALFIASQQAYVNGWVGAFWFVVPNILTLVIFGVLAVQLRERYPNGWTFSETIRTKFSKRVHNIYLTESLLLQVFSFAVQLLAGAMIFYKVTGIDFTLSTIIIGFIPLTYSLSAGIYTSINTDLWKMIFITVGLLLGLPILIYNVGFTDIFAGLSSYTGDIDSMFSGRGLEVTLTFGIPTTIALLSGAYGDQMFWQRAFSVKKKDIKKTMNLTAVVFGIVPIALTVFGFALAGAGVLVPDVQLTNLAAVSAYTPSWFLYVFFIIIISGLVSTLDSIINSSSSVVGIDIVNRLKDLKKLPLGLPRRFINTEEGRLKLARYSMIVIALLGVGIANIEGIKIVYLFLIYGTLRSAVMLPTVYSCLGIGMSEKGLFYGMFLAICVGLPFFAYFKLGGDALGIVCFSLFTVLTPGILSLIMDRKNRIV